MIYNEELENLRQHFLKIRFENELNFLETDVFTDLDVEEDPEWINTRKEKIKIILKGIDDNNKSENNLMDNMFNQINEYSYKKMWHLLQPFHRVEKIKDFLKENIENKDIRNNIEKTLLKLIYNNKLATKKAVIYDHKNEIIKSIPALEIMDTGEYTIKKKLI